MVEVKTLVGIYEFSDAHQSKHIKHTMTYSSMGLVKLIALEYSTLVNKML